MKQFIKKIGPKKKSTSNKVDFVYLKPWQLNHCTFVRNRVELIKRFPSHLKVAEVGVMSGEFSEKILKFINPSELHLIDIFKTVDTSNPSNFLAKDHKSFIDNKFRAEIEDAQVFVKKGKSWDRLSEYNDAYFDVIYIDANHSYDAVRQDLEQAHKKITIRVIFFDVGHKFLLTCFIV